MDKQQEHQHAAPDAASDNETAQNAADLAAAIETPTVDFSLMDDAPVVLPHIKDGIHLVTISKFEPRVNEEAGIVESWVFTLTTAERCPSTIEGQFIDESTRLGAYSIFVSPSQYRTMDACITIVKQTLMGLNDIAVDPKKDPRGNIAKTKWLALAPENKRPCYVPQQGGLPVLDAELEHYARWDGTLVLVRLATKAGKPTNLMEVLAVSTPRAAKR